MEDGSGARALEALAHAVADRARDHWGLPVTVLGLAPLSGGANRQLYVVDAEVGGEPVRWVVCRAAAGSRALSPADELAVLQTAAAAGVPVPEGHFLLDDQTYVMAYLEGEVLPSRVLREDGLTGARQRLARDCGTALARLHRLGADAVGGSFARRASAIPLAARVQRWRALVDRAPEPHPGLEAALCWIEDHAPPGRPEGLVHGDFRLGNLMVGPDGLRGVLDWELVSVGDPLEDLAYLCARPWRFGRDHLEVGGFGHRHDLYAAYLDAGGPEIDERSVHVWEVVANVRWAAGCIHQAGRFLDGSAPSLEMAAIGRRTCEPTFDALALMGGGGPVGDLDVDPGAELVTGQDEPAFERLAAATSDAVSALGSGRGERYQARIAANLVRILAREARLGPLADRADAADIGRVTGLGGTPAERRVRLAQAIRARAVPVDAETIALCRRLAARQLLVANPGYLQPQVPGRSVGGVATDR